SKEPTAIEPAMALSFSGSVNCGFVAGRFSEWDLVVRWRAGRGFGCRHRGSLWFGFLVELAPVAHDGAALAGVTLFFADRLHDESVISVVARMFDQRQVHIDGALLAMEEAFLFEFLNVEFDGDHRNEGFMRLGVALARAWRASLSRRAGVPCCFRCGIRGKAFLFPGRIPPG